MWSTSCAAQRLRSPPFIRTQRGSARRRRRRELDGRRHGRLPSSLLERSWCRVHPEGLRSSKGNVRVEGEWLPVDEPQARKPPGQSLEGNLRFELAQGGAQAVMDPLAKREGLRRVRPFEIELLRLREDGGVAP